MAALDGDGNFEFASAALRDAASDWNSCSAPTGAWWTSSKVMAGPASTVSTVRARMSGR